MFRNIFGPKMTAYPGNEHDMDVRFFLSETLLNEKHFEVLGIVLAEKASSWSSKLHIWRGRGEDNTPLNISDPKSIYEPIRTALLERGPTYHKLLKEKEVAPKQRNSGSIGIKGKNTSLGLVVGVDDYPLWPLAGRYNWGNYISFHIGSSVIEGAYKAHEWVSEVFCFLCEKLPVVYAHAQCSADYFNKNIDASNGGRRAVGIDFAKCLPGVYWLNYFGEPYAELMGKNKLLSANVFEAKEINKGVSIQISESPQHWHEKNYQNSEKNFLKHIGDQYFFSKQSPNRKTIAPEFDLPKPNFPNKNKPIQVLHDDSTGELKLIDDGKLSEL